MDQLGNFNTLIAPKPELSGIVSEIGSARRNSVYGNKVVSLRDSDIKNTPAMVSAKSKVFKPVLT